MDNFIEVSKNDFYKFIANSDVNPQSDTSKFPYTSLFKNKFGYIYGKTVDYRDGATIKTKYYIPNSP